MFVRSSCRYDAGRNDDIPFRLLQRKFFLVTPVAILHIDKPTYVASRQTTRVSNTYMADYSIPFDHQVNTERLNRDVGALRNSAVPSLPVRNPSKYASSTEKQKGETGNRIALHRLKIMPEHLSSPSL